MLHQLSLCEDTTRDRHRLQFLKKQLVGIRNLYRTEARRVPAAPARPDALLRIHNRNQTAVLARPASEEITALHEPLLRELRDTVRNHAIPLHLTKAETTLPRAPLCRLPSEHHERP